MGYCWDCGKKIELKDSYAKNQMGIITRICEECFKKQLK